MYLLYNLLAIMLVVLAAPVFLIRLVRETGFGERLRQSFGFLPGETVTKVAGKDCIWLHAASVGEIVAASPLVREMRHTFPDRPILISVVTASGYTMAQRIIKEADGIIFFPIDLPGLSRKVIDRIKPAVFLPVETELWPNFLRACRTNNIPVMMVNGRISDKSSIRYRYLGSILRDMLNTVTKFCMQSTIDAEYIIRLGADPARVVVTGNTKYDQTYTDVSADEQKRLADELGISAKNPVFVAGSTHEGEEEIIFNSLKAIKDQNPTLAALIAPRDILRADELKALAGNHGFTAIRRSALKESASTGHNVVILDTIGELGRVYSLGDVVFVGGSLVPRGGHNILEPAAHGKPILVGPQMFNFKDIYALLSGRQACVTVQDGADLTAKLATLLADESAAKEMGANARAVVDENRGAAARNVEQLKALLQ